ncbi:MAG: L-seryl-tRNA(Sec) selenium transferase [Deltaproteobacteria bacterium]|jgi:L-seryl-tRNA(Ser) seleniumtransferase|nr:L-seryl-tRNA(Sec) selenium transferase [Deltaproteobacteria bacterium]
MSNRHSLLRQLPAIDKILNCPEIAALAKSNPHLILREAAQKTVERIRKQLLAEQAPVPDLSFESVIEQVQQKIKELSRPSLRKVINVTGTVLHTNLGRAPLSNAALLAIQETARSYSNLEYNLDLGERGQRFSHVEELLCKLTGGEAATVVNNNAGAVLLSLAALASGRSALVSRGEMIEIGGSFRIPDVMSAGGVNLVEVGTTNKTHLSDFHDAIDPDVALIMKVHTSNYRILGFTDSVSGEQLAGLAHKHGIPVLEDLGSGLLLDLTPYGLPREPTVREVLATGIDLVTFSGDKLLGGPQAGVIVGRKTVIDRLRRHPMARAMRIDKLTLAAFEATLRLYLDPQKALKDIPALNMLITPADELKKRCTRLLPKISKAIEGKYRTEIVPSSSTVGGGALPLTELPGWAIAVTPLNLSINSLITKLRRTEPPVIGRIHENQMLIDPRTLFDDEIDQLCAAISQAAGES